MVGFGRGPARLQRARAGRDRRGRRLARGGARRRGRLLRLRARGRASRPGGRRAGRRAGGLRGQRRGLHEGGAGGRIDDQRFVGGHPIAGAETSGVEHARADLFQGAVWYLTPLETLVGAPLRAPAPAGQAAGRPARGGGPRRPTIAWWRCSATCPTCWPTCWSPRAPSASWSRARRCATWDPASATARAWPARTRRCGPTSTARTARRWRGGAPLRAARLRCGRRDPRRRRGRGRLERRRPRRPPAAARDRPGRGPVHELRLTCRTAPVSSPRWRWRWARQG